MSRQSEYQKKRYWDRKEQGLCVRCGENKARPGKTQCAECAEKSRECVAQMRATWRTTGRCIMCGKPFFAEKETNTICKTCRGKLNANTNKLHNDRKKNRLCPTCGKRPPEEGKSLCRACLDRNNEASKRYYTKKKENLKYDVRRS